MFFNYRPGEIPETPSPRAVYALIDQIEPLDPAGKVSPLLLLDCIDAEWVDKQEKIEPMWAMRDRGADFSISI